MALDPKPWFTSTEGVEHSSEVARSLAFMAVGGKAGIANVGDLRVSAKSTPTGKVNVAPGVAAIISRYPGGSNQAYIARNISQTEVTIKPTSSTGARTDLVVLRIQDLAFEGSTSGNVNDYDFTRLEVIQGVSNSIWSADELNLPYPALALARIRIPASTSAITQAMITDLRKVANPREQSSVIYNAITANENVGNNLKLWSRTPYPRGEWFPNVGGPNNNGIYEVDVPSWATQMEIRAEWLSVRMAPKAGWGGVWMSFGPDAGVTSTNPTHYTQSVNWDAQEDGSVYRTNFILVDTKAVPYSFRGKPMKFVLRGNRIDPSGGNYPGEVGLDANSALAISFRFLERPDDTSA